jgi:hypothetical protein
MSPTQRTPTVKLDLQSLLLDMTPLRLADLLWAESQGKKHESQREQAQKMIKTQGKDIANKGTAPGAVVLFSVITMQSAILSEFLVLFTR